MNTNIMIKSNPIIEKTLLNETKKEVKHKYFYKKNLMGWPWSSG